MSTAVIAKKVKMVSALTETALEEGVEPVTILNEGLIAGMNVIGVRFKANEIYVPEVLIAAWAMQA